MKASDAKVTNISYVNTSGIYPVDLKVLVKPETLEEKTKGGIVIPDTVKSRHDMAGIKATLVACGPQAFEETKDYKSRPVAGQIVAISKYAGYLIRGKDGVEYRLINDGDIAAQLDGDWDIRSMI